MIIAIIFGVFLSTMTHTTVVMDDCKERGFEPKACGIAEKIHKVGEKHGGQNRE